METKLELLTLLEDAQLKLYPNHPTKLVYQVRDKQVYLLFYRKQHSILHWTLCGRNDWLTPSGDVYLWHSCSQRTTYFLQTFARCMNCCVDAGWCNGDVASKLLSMVMMYWRELNKVALAAVLKSWSNRSSLHVKIILLPLTQSKLCSLHGRSLHWFHLWYSCQHKDMLPIDTSLT